MPRRSVPLLFAVALAALLGPGHAQQPPAPAASPDLGGAWTLRGWNIDVDPASVPPNFTGSVNLEKKDHDTYLVSWVVGGREVNRGVGLFDPRTGTFAAGYAIPTRDGPSPGVAIWQLSADRRQMDCVGTFQGKIGHVAHESWRRE